MTEKTPKIQINAELTPNPNTLKFNLNLHLLETGSCNFPDSVSAQNSLLAAELFTLGFVTGVFIGTDFVTVTKTPDKEWHDIARPVVDALRIFLESGREAVSPTLVIQQTGKTEIEQKIIDILDQEIRPAVARDGGDIVFYGYDDGVVKLHLQGSCSSCPSSVMTLKMGIENRLKQVLPEIKEVLQV